MPLAPLFLGGSGWLSHKGKLTDPEGVAGFSFFTVTMAQCQVLPGKLCALLTRRMRRIIVGHPEMAGLPLSLMSCQGVTFESSL